MSYQNLTSLPQRSRRDARTRGLAILATAVMSMGLAACADDDDTTASGDEAPIGTDNDATTEAPQLEGSVRVMVIAPITDPATGGINDYPEIATGAEAAARVINDSGGVNGAAIEVEVCDTRNDSNEGINCATRAAREGFVAVVGSLDNAGNYAPTLREAGIPNIAPYASAALLADPNTYPTYGGQLVYFLGGLTVLVPEGVTSLSVPYIDAGPLGAQLQALSGAFNAVHPDVSVSFVPVSPNQGDYSSIVTTAARSDGIFLAMPAEAIVQFLQTANQLGIENPISVPSATLQGAALEDLGDLAEGLYTVTAYLSSTERTNDAVTEYVDALTSIDPDAYRSDFSANAYAGVRIVAHALEGATELTALTLTERLNSLTDLDLGLLPPIQFTTPVTTFGPDLTRVFNDDVIFVRVSNGQLVAHSDFVDVMTGE